MLEIEPVRAKRTFVLFGEDEKRDLLRTMLSEQGRGVSVRGCAIALAGGERSQMLRYQNKYRNLVRSNPDLVRQVMIELENQGMPCTDPYAPSTVPRRGRPAGRKSTRGNKGLLAITASLVSDLESIGEGEGEMFLSRLAALVHLAVEPVTMQAENEQFRKLAARYENLSQEYQALREQVEKQQHAAWKQREAIAEATLTPVEALTALLNANRMFLALEAPEKLTGLEGYTAQLTQCLQYMEGTMVQ